MASASKSKKLSISATSVESSKYTLTASFNQTSTDIVNNSSTIKVTGKMSSKSYSFTGTSCKLIIYWFDDNTNSNGKKVGEISLSSMGANSTKTVNGNVTVPHKADGTLNGYARARWERSSGNSYCPATNNIDTSNTALDTVPRKSIISNLWGDLRNSFCTKAFGINYDVKYSGFTHELLVTNSANGYTKTYNFLTSKVEFQDTSSSSYYGMDFYSLNSLIPNSKKISFTFRLKTYSNGVLIGEDIAYKDYEVVGTEITFNYTIEANDTLTRNLTGVINKFINDVSEIKATISNVNVISRANIQSYQFYYNGDDNQSINSNNYIFYKKSSVSNIELWLGVNDTRGYSIRDTSPRLNILNYFKPNVNISAKRLDSTSTSATVTASGSFWNGNFGAVQNHLKLYVGYKRTSDSDYTYFDVIPTINGNNYTYQFQIDNIPTNEEVNLWVDPTDQVIRIRNNTAIINRSISVIDFGDDYLGINNDVEINGNSYHYNANGDSFVSVEKVGGRRISLMAGNGGINRGLWDFSLSKWLLYHDDNLLRLNNNTKIMGKLSIDSFSRNKNDTWMPVISGGGILDYTLRHLPNEVTTSLYNDEEKRDNIATLRTLSLWNGAYNGTQSNLKYSANGEIVGYKNHSASGNFSGHIRLNDGLLIQWGQVQVSSPANAVGNTSITFPIGYSNLPVVMVTASSSVPYTNVRGVSAQSSNSGATIYMCRTNTTSTGVNWLAIGY